MEGGPASAVAANRKLVRKVAAGRNHEGGLKGKFVFFLRTRRDVAALRAWKRAAAGRTVGGGVDSDLQWRGSGGSSHRASWLRQRNSQFRAIFYDRVQIFFLKCSSVEAQTKLLVTIPPAPPPLKFLN